MPANWPQLALWAYSLTSPSARIEYGAEIEELHISTVAPGGYREMSCQIRVPDGQTAAISPQLAIFANVAVMDGPFPVFLGRWDEAAVILSESGNDGDLLELHAMGGADCLKDDPQDTTYSVQTVASILSDQMTGPTGVTPARSHYLELDSDQTNIVITGGDASLTYSPVEQGKTFEDVLNDILPALGDYQWTVWGHYYHKDAAGFPTWQLNVAKRNTTTVSYTAYTADEVSHDIRPSVEYSYNAVTVFYRDSGTNLPAVITVTDSRLNANGSQGGAPFPYRHLRKDLSNTHLTSSQASSIATALLNQYLNGGLKITVVLHTVRDPYNNEIPLWKVRADSNILLPELLQRVAPVPTAPTTNVNLFYIDETTYDENAGSIPQLTIACVTFRDVASFLIAKMQYVTLHQTSGTKTIHHLRSPGAPEIGQVGMTFNNVSAGSQVGVTQNFQTQMSAAPSSISLSVVRQSNTSAVTVTDITNQGFTVLWTPTLSGTSYYVATYTTVGN